MHKKIVFLDVDGTLVSGPGKVSDKVKEGIVKARQNGHFIFVCTGRNRAGIEDLLEIGFDGMICSAGSYVEVNDQVIFDCGLEEDEVKKARLIFEKNHIFYNLETTHKTFQDDDMNELFARTSSQNTHNFEFQRMMREFNERFHVSPLKDYDKNPIPVKKICFIAMKEEDLQEPKKLLSSQYHFIIHEIFSKEVINGEIILKGRDKATGVQKVVEALHMSMEDTIGFGDSMNDLEMIQACAIGVVMKNGTTELKKYADLICDSVDNDGVYDGMQRLGLLE